MTHNPSLRNGQTETPSEEGVSASAGVAPDGVALGTVADKADESIPLEGGYRTDDHRYYFNGEGPLPSVTTILEVISKPAVGIFKAKEAARAVLSDPDRFVVQLDDPTFQSGMDERIKWALEESDKARDRAAELGSSVHLLADLLGAQENDSKGFQISDSEKPYLDAYNDFLGHYGRSNIVSSEHMVWSLDGYAGTYDQLMMIDGELWLIDIKTSGKGPYPEWGLQLAAYAWAHWIIVPGQRQPHQMPAVTRFGVLHLRPDLYPDTGWRLIEYPCTSRDYDAFLSALDLWKWKKEGRFTKSVLVGRKKKQAEKAG